MNWKKALLVFVGLVVGFGLGVAPGVGECLSTRAGDLPVGVVAVCTG